MTSRRSPRQQPHARRAFAAGSVGDAGRVTLRILAIPLLILGAGLLLAATLAPGAALAASWVRTVEAQVFDFPPLPEDLRELSERSVILDRDGNRLAVIREEDRVLVALDEVPEHVRAAIIATEDQDFHEHAGVNWQSIVRAAAGNVQAGEITAGASTITQQLVKNLVLETNEQTLDRKLQEAVYAIDLEQRMGKDAILESYLNTAFFGNRTYGVAAAAEYYWGKPASQLSVSEGALLAGLLRAPETNDPVGNPDNALARRNIVLGQMAAVGAISRQEAERLAAEPLALNVRPRDDATDNDVVTYLIEQLKALPALGDDPERAFRYLATGGLEITTTIDPELQDLADQAIRNHLSAEEEPLGALSAVDPRTGELLAVGFGPRDFGKGEGQVDVNPAVPGLGSPGRQSGSAFKAFEIVAALEDGLSPAYTIDTPSPYQPAGECANLAGGWEPGNYADSGGGVMDMTRATAVSSNIYFSHLVDEVTGPARLKETAERMGIAKELGGNCAAVLGTDTVHMLDMASAFGTLANGGVHCEPYAVAEVRDRTGRVIHSGGDRCDRAVEEGIAARATAMLEGPISGGTASRNGQIGRPAAGKTGTTDDYRDAWFVGFVPRLSAAVWVGRESGNEPLTHPDCPQGMTGGCVPTAIWADFMRGAVDALQLPPDGFPEPPPLPTSQVPAVVGRQADDAQRRIAEAGFRPILETVADYRPAGTVVEQAPGGGSRAPTGSAVRLSVSDGSGEEPRIPDLVGLTVDEARAAVERLDLGLSLGVEEVPVDDIGQIGAVVAQDPAAGSPAQEGGTVTVEVGRQRGPEDEPSPTPTPTATPTLEPPGERPTGDPTVGPPLPGPSPDPTESPTAEPTEEPGPSPSPEPTSPEPTSPEPTSPGPPDDGPPGRDGDGDGGGEGDG